MPATAGTPTEDFLGRRRLDVNMRARVLIVSAFKDDTVLADLRAAALPGETIVHVPKPAKFAVIAAFLDEVHPADGVE